MLDQVLYLLLGSVLFNLCLYVIAYLAQSDKLTDLSYAFTFFAINLVGFSLSEKSNLDWMLFILISVWALRIGGYLFVRIMKIGRDKRFDPFRSNAISFLGFWLMQGITCAIVSFSSFLTYVHDEKILTVGAFIGGFIALAGLMLETIADHQKFKFKLKQPNAFMNKALWKKLRHPNYTGEILFWFGIFIIGINHTPLYIAMLSPLWIILILIKFSGIPILEKTWSEKYGHIPAYQKHLAQSYRLIPFIY